MSARQSQDSVAKDGSPILRLLRSRKGTWRRGRLDLTSGDLFLHDGNVRWRRRAVSNGNPRSLARSPSCRDCAFLPAVRYRCLCRDRCRLSVTSSTPPLPTGGGNKRNTGFVDFIEGAGIFRGRHLRSPPAGAGTDRNRGRDQQFPCHINEGVATGWWRPSRASFRRSNQ